MLGVIIQMTIWKSHECQHFTSYLFILSPIFIPPPFFTIIYALTDYTQEAGENVREETAYEPTDYHLIGAATHVSLV